MNELAGKVAQRNGSLTYRWLFLRRGAQDGVQDSCGYWRMDQLLTPEGPRALRSGQKKFFLARLQKIQLTLL
jgi:hypothetical protein